MLHKAQNEKAVIFLLPFFIHLSVEYVIVAFVVERGNLGVVLENGGGNLGVVLENGGSVGENGLEASW